VENNSSRGSRQQQSRAVAQWSSQQVIAVQVMKLHLS